MKGLDGGDFPEHGGIVQRFIEVGTAALQVRQVDILPPVEGVGDDMVIGVFGLGLADGDEEDGIEHGNQGKADQRGPLEMPAAVFAEAEQVGHRADTDHGNSHVGPEPGGVFFQAEGHVCKLPVLFGEGGHEADDRRNGCGDGERPGDGAFPVDPLIFQSHHRGQGHHQGKHVIPAGIIGAVHQLEGGIEEGHQGHQEQNPQHLLEPVLPAQLQPADDAGHAEQGQPRAQGCPFRFRLRREIGPGRQVRREEEALENVQVTLVFVIEHGVPAVDVIGGPVILGDGQHRGDQQHAGHAHPQHCLQRQQQEVPQGDAPASAQQPQEKVDQREGDLAHEEIVVYKAAGEHGEGKQAPPAVFHVFVQRGQHQGEEDDGLVEVVEENIVDGKAGKGVEHRADQGGVPAFGVPVQVDVARQRGRGEFQDKQRPHQVLQGLRREGDGEPEERASQQVEGIGAHKVGPQVRQMAPAPVSGTDGVMGDAVERHLLYVEIAVKQEPAPVYQKKREKDQERQPHAQKECFEEIVVPPASVLSFLNRCFHSDDHTFLKGICGGQAVHPNSRDASAFPRAADFDSNYTTFPGWKKVVF